MRRARLLTLLAAIAVALAAPAVASAHKPIFLDPPARTPGGAPLIEDGTVSFAAYGRLDREDDRRYLKVRFRKGDAMLVELLLPDRAPERDLKPYALPTVTVIAPDGRRRVLGANERTGFDEPITGTSYIRLRTWSGKARLDGTYTLVVRGPEPLRFCLATGLREVFGVEDVAGLPAALKRVRDWYRG